MFKKHGNQFNKVLREFILFGPFRTDEILSSFEDYHLEIVMVELIFQIDKEPTAICAFSKLSVICPCIAYNLPFFYIEIHHQDAAELFILFMVEIIVMLICNMSILFECYIWSLLAAALLIIIIIFYAFKKSRLEGFTVPTHTDCNGVWDHVVGAPFFS